MSESKIRSRRPRVDAATKQKVCELYTNSSMKVQEIASMCNISVGTLYRIIKEA